MKSLISLFIIVFILITIPLLGAQIIFYDKPEGTYNLGDTLEINFSLQRQIPSSGFIDVSLVCGSKSFLLYRTFLNLNANEKRYILFSWKEQSLIGNSCRVLVSFQGLEDKTTPFILSDKISVEAYLNKFSFLPSEDIIITGSANKENGNPLNGFARIIFNEQISQSISVLNGSFSYTFQLNELTPPENYSLKLEVFEEDSFGKTLNSGYFEIPLRVLSKPKIIEIQSKNSFLPEEVMNFSFFLRDQSGNLLKNESILFKLFNPNNEVILEGTTKSDVVINYTFNSNGSSGPWRIAAFFGSISNQKYVFLDGLPKIVIEFNNNQFIISNIGNAPFEGIIEFLFTNSEEQTFNHPLNLNLLAGEIYYFSPPLETGDYEVFVENIDWGHISFTKNLGITGAIIGLVNSDFNVLFILFLFLFLILAFFLILKKRFFKRRDKNTTKKEINTLYLKSKKIPVYSNSDKRIFSIFFRCRPPFSKKLKEILNKENIILKEISEEVFFSIFRYNKFPNPETNLVKLVKRVIDLCKKKNEIIETMIHLSEKGEDLKQFLVLSEKIFERKLGKFLITEKIYNVLKPDKKRFFSKIKSFKVRENIINIYSYG